MSKQSNLGSAPPSPIDIDTPDGSIFGADLRDNETQYTHQWNEQQQQLINAYRNYHYEMMLFIDMLREVAKLLCKYPRFRSLGLSFSEIYQHRKQIQVMLATDSSVAKYWHQANW